jgi:hypothetical protein
VLEFSRSHARWTTSCSVPFNPIWQSCVETDQPARFHGGTARPPYGPGTFEMGNNLFVQCSATNPFEVMRGIASFIGAGVLDLFPKLGCAFLQAALDGCRSGWSGSMSITS